MKDIKSISKNYFGKIKSSLGYKTEYAKIFKEADPDYYEKIFDGKPLVLEDFFKFFKSKQNIKSVLEIGCSAGIFPIKHKELFENMQYTGLDISERCISYCKEHSDHNFECSDFLQKEISAQWDFVFSFDVIDHVYDVQQFLSNLVKSTKKYAYVAAYVGYFPNLENHTRRWDDNDGIYFNSLSVQNLKQNLIDLGLSDDEFVIRPQKQGFGDTDHTETIIEINRK